MKITDKMRLDWLDSAPPLKIISAEPRFPKFLIMVGRDMFYRETSRESIDAAIRAAGRKRP